MDKVIEEYKSRRAKRLDRRFSGNYEKVAEFRKRRAARLDAKNADDEEGRWVTTENNHKVHINEEGEPDKGNPHVLAVMQSGEKADAPKSIERFGKTPAERTKKRKDLTKACMEGLKGYRPVLKMRKEVLQAKRDYVHQFDVVQKELSVLEGVTADNLEAKKKELDQKISEAYDKEFKLDYERDIDETGKKQSEYEYAVIKRKGLEADRRLLNDFDFNKERLESVKENRKPYDLEYEQAKKDYESAQEHMHGIIDKYNKQVDEMNAAILAKYPNNDAIKSVDDAEEYMLAKGIVRAEATGGEFDGQVRGEPVGGSVSLAGCDDSTAKAMCRVVDKLYEKFPDMSRSYRGISVLGPEFFSGEAGNENGGVVHLNSDYFHGDSEATEGFLTGFHPKFKSTSKTIVAESIFAHESGHALDEHLCRMFPNMVDEVYYAGGGGMFSRYMNSVAPKLLTKAAKNLGMTKTAMKQAISGYACKNDIEAFAEAFSEYLVSDEPRPIAQEIGRQIESLYRAGKLLGKEKKK